MKTGIRSPGMVWTRLALLVTACVAQAHAASVEVIGHTTIPNDQRFEKTLTGGLSGISYDAATRSFWAISDDSNGKGGPPRAYQLAIPFDADGIQSPQILRVVILRDAEGRLLKADCEGIAATGRGGIWVSSEGKGNALPFVQLFDVKTGRSIRNLPLPGVYLPKDAAGKPVRAGAAAQVSGILTNKSLESCAVSPDLQTVYTANETSLMQEKADGEGKGGASIFNGTQVRISALNAKTGALQAQKLYQSDAGCLFGSISDLCAVDNKGKLLVLERRVIGLSEGPGSCGIRIYQVDLAQDSATDLLNIPNVNTSGATPLKKTLVFDSRASGIENLDNVEGFCLAPLPGGGAVLAGISDNNFNKAQQTQIWIFRYNP